MRLSATPVTAYFPETCPRCFAFQGGTAQSCACGYALARTYVIPYDVTWQYTAAVCEELQSHQGARLLGKFRGAHPEQLASFNHWRYLYVSRYPHFSFGWLAAFAGLEFLELDYIGLESLSGISALRGLLGLNLTECRKLTDASELAAVPNLELLRIALCSRLADLSALQGMASLRRLDIEARRIDSLLPLRALETLETLNLAIERVPDESVSIVEELPRLRRLGLGRRLARPGLVSALSSRVPDLEVTVFT